MPERTTGIGDPTPTPERLLQPGDLLLLRAIATVPSRGLVAGILAQNPTRAFNVTEVDDAFRHLMGLNSGDKSPYLITSTEVRHYEEFLRAYGYVVQSPVERPGMSYAGEGNEAEGMQITPDLEPKIILAILGHMFHFMELYPDIPLAKVLTNASKNPLDVDSLTKRARIISYLAREYREHKKTEEPFFITAETLQQQTDLNTNDISYHRTSLIKDFDLVTALPTGYRVLRRVDPATIARKDMRDAYTAILRAEAEALGRGESIKERYFTEHTLRQLGSANGYGGGLVELANQNYLATLPRASMTVDDDQGEILEALAAIIDGAATRSPKFITDGLTYAKVLSDPESVNTLLGIEHVTARGRKEHKEVALNAIEEIVGAHSGSSPALILEFFRLLVKDGLLDGSLRFYGLSSIRSALGTLREEGKLQFAQKNPPTGRKHWYKPPTTAQEVAQPVSIAETPPLTDIVQAVPTVEESPPSVGDGEQPALEESFTEAMVVTEPSQIQEPMQQKERELVIYTGEEALNQIKKGKPAIIFGTTFERLSSVSLQEEEDGEDESPEESTVTEQNQQGATYGMIFAADTFEDLEQVIGRILDKELPTGVEFTSSATGMILRAIKEFKDTPKIPPRSTDMNAHVEERRILRDRFFVLNGDQVNIVEGSNGPEFYLKRDDGSQILLRMTSPLMSSLVQAMRNPTPKE